MSAEWRPYVSLHYYVAQVTLNSKKKKCDWQKNKTKNPFMFDSIRFCQCSEALHRTTKTYGFVYHVNDYHGLEWQQKKKDSNNNDDHKYARKMFMSKQSNW